ncbi:BPL-N domain-containing protein [Photobacterium kasasachensis]|uniref:BPL-N domain-containing protein n=1 Tax=Photobacterium kasasachensis TaxID=2910240 RepID=UPI003D0D4965
MNILIYTDNVSTNHILYYALGRLRGKKNIYFVNANEILEGALSSDIDLFVMPGGASRYKAAKLNGAANRLIKKYVAEGGRYLGICAGAYMACETTYWAKGQPFEIATKNELCFFPGIAQGPVATFGRGDNFNSTEARLVALELNGKQVISLYLGGCVFQPIAETGYKVLATFAELAEKPPAIVCGEYGKGAWLLSSTHPEYDQEALELMKFDVVGNDYQGFSRLQSDSSLNLDLLDYLLVKLFE